MNEVTRQNILMMDRQIQFYEKIIADLEEKMKNSGRYSEDTDGNKIDLQETLEVRKEELGDIKAFRSRL